MKKNGFTFIELLIYIALVSVLATVSVLFVTNVTSSRVKVKVQEEVMYSARFLSERIGREIRGASAITSLAANDLCLVMVDAARNPTRIYLSAGRARIGWGGGGACSATTNNYDLTGPDITVNSLGFVNLTSGLSENIDYSISISGKNINNRQEWIFDTSLEGSSEIRTN
jgi:prepilin-type N-terminal cleavage/methylation domain-containing protein